jgi:large subunit ribosomal protein L10
MMAETKTVQREKSAAQREIPQRKKDKVKELAKTIDESKIVAIVDMTKLPAKQMQHIRQNLRGKVRIVMSNKALMSRALDSSKKKDVDKLKEFLSGMPAFILTSIDPFELSVMIDKEKVASSPRAGDIAPRDIVVPAGPTPFAPGPVIAELAEFGLKTKVEAAKLAIIKDTVVAKEGEEIDPKLVPILKRLDVKPMKVGLNLSAVYEDGKIYYGDVLVISLDEYAGKIASAHTAAYNLAFEAKFVTDETVLPLLSQANSMAWNLAINMAVLSDETKEIVLSITNSQMMAIAHILNEKDPKSLSESFSKKLSEEEIKEVFGGE